MEWRPAGMGTPPVGLHAIAMIISAKLSTVIHPMDVYSLNFDAEVLGKRLAVARFGPPGTIANGKYRASFPSSGCDSAASPAAPSPGGPM